MHFGSRILSGVTVLKICKGLFSAGKGVYSFFNGQIPFQKEFDTLNRKVYVVTVISLVTDSGSVPDVSSSLQCHFVAAYEVIKNEYMGVNQATKFGIIILDKLLQLKH